MAQLEDLRRSHKSEIKEGIAKAEEEVKRLEGRKEELLRLIESARAWLGEEVRSERPENLTLHAAMRLVLLDHPEGLTGPELRDEINNRNLYRRRDGKPLGTSQLHARTSSKPAVFWKHRGCIMLTDAGREG